MFQPFFNLEECVSLESLCNTFVDGDWIESKDQDTSGIRLIQTGNVGISKYLDKADKARFINEETFGRLNCTEVLPGDILISRLPDPIARSCIIPDGLGKSITGVDCTIVRFKDKINPVFFNQYTLIDHYLSQISAFEAGSTRKRISRKNLGKIKVPLPPMDLQNQFASFVEQVDKSKVVQPTTTKSRFIEMFGNPVTNEKGWTVDTIENLFDVRGRVGWKGYTKNDLVSEGPLVIGGSEIEGGIVVFKNPVHLSKEKYVESPEIMVQQNDLIIASRGTIGTCAIVSQNFGEVTINPCVILMRPKGVNSNFFVRLFNMPQVQSTLKEIGSGAVQPMISQGNLKKFKIIVPPTSLQDSFMRFIQQVDKSKVAISGV